MGGAKGPQHHYPRHQGQCSCCHQPGQVQGTLAQGCLEGTEVSIYSSPGEGRGHEELGVEGPCAGTHAEEEDIRVVAHLSPSPSPVALLASLGGSTWETFVFLRLASSDLSNLFP